MVFLAIETSNPRGSVALFDGDGPAREWPVGEGPSQARALVARVRELLEAHGFAPHDLGGIAVSAGPGSYTGCRVGVTAAKTLAFAQRLPVAAVSSLEVLAAGAAEGTSGERGAPAALAPVLDARRGHFYGAFFTWAAGSGLLRRAPDQVGDARSLAVRCPPGTWVFGEGADAFLRALEDGEAAEAPVLRRGPREWDVPRAGVLAALVRERLLSASFDSEAVHGLEPAYLRPSGPEMLLAERARGAVREDGREE